MDKLKQYVVFTVLGCLLVLAAGWFLLISPKRTEAADLRAVAATQVTANAQLETQLQLLKAQAKDLPKQQAKLAAVAARIPDNPALPAMVRALTTAATSAGVELVSMTPGTPAVIAAAPVAAPVAPAAAAPAAAPPARTVAAASTATAGQLAQIPVTLNVVGGYFQIQQFVASLENLSRSMRLTALTVAPGTNPLKVTPVNGTGGAPVADGRTLTSTITAQVYMAANRPALTPVTVPGGAVAGTVGGPVVPVTPAKK
ncbi:MAG: type 4a pilus biogenesis protein PilO [Frankiaceae bacterium]|nr:type 4a pilus biogenesis protein PilO [Frankiaceae bacterium]